MVLVFPHKLKAHLLSLQRQGLMDLWYDRVPDPHDKRKLASWLSRPLFKRVARGRYKLLSPDEIALFHERVKEGDPRIYEDEYNIDDLIITNLKTSEGEK